MYDLQSAANDLAILLKDRSDTVGVSESSAGGLISATLLGIPGASAYFVGGTVTYTRLAQRGLLGVTDKDMLNVRASTEEYALINARAVKTRLKATWGLSETGASGPNGNRYGDNAGHTCIAVSGPVERTATLETSNDNRVENMWMFAIKAINLLEECVSKVNQNVNQI